MSNIFIGRNSGPSSYTVYIVPTYFSGNGESYSPFTIFLAIFPAELSERAPIEEFIVHAPLAITRLVLLFNNIMHGKDMREIIVAVIKMRLYDSCEGNDCPSILVAES